MILCDIRDVTTKGSIIKHFMWCRTFPQLSMITGTNMIPSLMLIFSLFQIIWCSEVCGHGRGCTAGRNETVSAVSCQQQSECECDDNISIIPWWSLSILVPPQTFLIRIWNLTISFWVTWTKRLWQNNCLILISWFCANGWDDRKNVQNFIK